MELQKLQTLVKKVAVAELKGSKKILVTLLGLSASW